MAIVSNPLPIDRFTVGNRVCWFDPDQTAASAKYGEVTAVVHNQSGTGDPVSLTVQPSDGSAAVTASGVYFRVVDDVADADLDPAV